MHRSAAHLVQKPGVHFRAKRQEHLGEQGRIAGRSASEGIFAISASR
jgi:hypothetical protein